MDQAALHNRAKTRGANLFVYWIVRVPMQLVALVYFRLSRMGREHIPQSGPAIIASNHRSFLDPFLIGMMAPRPLYYVAKREIFFHPIASWLLSSLGAFPVARGEGDGEMIITAKALLARGELVLMFPEGTRTRPGPLGNPRRGVGRLVLETGAPVVPLAIIGTEAVRRGWLFRPHKVRIRAGEPLTFAAVQTPSPELATPVVERIWASVELQWEWLGGTPRTAPTESASAGEPNDRLELESVGELAARGSR